jgi:ribulose 1,5-bisphosphate synthetase/thiazole synthase
MSTERKTTRRTILAAAGALLAGGPALAAESAREHGQNAFLQPGVRHRTLDEVDVLVVGGGPAGIGAALGAARKGANTLLVENHSFFGGVAAWALGMPINQVRPGGKARSAVHELVVEKIKAYGDQAVRMGKHELWCNVEYLKVAALDALDQVGCRYLVHVRAADAIVENNRVTGVVIATKRGLMTIRAKAVVDCTGDADVSYYAGAETMKDTDALMPMTLGLSITNIDSMKIRTADVERTIRGSRTRFPLITSGFVEVKQLAHSASWWINHAGTADLGRVDPTDLEQRTKAECFGRRQAMQMVQSLRQSDNAAMKQIEWSGAGPQLSVREGRRIKGIYVITEEDARAGRTFDDAIAWRSGFLDPGGQTNTTLTTMKVHDVPFRSLLPEKLDGLLCAGRCISATHMGAAAGKSMGNCIATGHAAGLAAAMASSKNILTREVNVRALQDALRADGVNLELKDRDQKDL